MAEKKRRARGEGSIRQQPNGTWEARFVIGVDPGTGKDIRKSIYGKTQKEVRKKMTEAVAALDKDDYREPCKTSGARNIGATLRTTPRRPMLLISKTISSPALEP